MKIVYLKRGILFSAVFLVLLMGMFFTTGAADKEKTILVIPFQINSAEPLDFLKKGIDQMLATRLAEPGRSRVVFASDAQHAREFDADYIVEGTILIFGDQVSTDVKLIEAGSGTVALSVNQTGSQKGDVIKHIDQFTQNVRDHLWGAGAAAVPVVPNVPAPPISTTVKDAAPPTVNQAPPTAASPAATQQIWRGPFMDISIDSLQVADIDNDGKNEILVLADNVVKIYRREGDRLVPIAETKIDAINITCLFVDAIDLDKDGPKEVCITAVNEQHTRAASLVYRVENMQLVRLLGPVNYLLRVVDTADGPILLGQKTRGEDSQVLKTPVVELRLEQGGQRLVAEGKNFAFADNVFGIAFGDFMHNGTETIAVLGLSGIISLYSPAGEALYKGSDEYGGSTAYVAYKGMRYTKEDGYKLDRIFLQQRLFAADLDRDGKTELIAVKNSDSAKKLLSYTRVYRKSRIDELLWNELGFVVQEQGQSLSGYISDYCIGDTNVDGKQELVFTVVSSAKLFKKKRSQIFSIQKN
jgi:TolB-like protein